MMNGNLDIPNPLPGECSRSEHSVRLFELCLVVMVGFGTSMFHSVYPLLGGAHAAGWFRNSYFQLSGILEGAIILALLGYVLWRQGRSDPNLGSTATPRNELLPAPRLRAIRWVCLVKQVSLFEWCLVLLVAFWSPLSQSLYYWLRSRDWEPGALVRNLPDATHLVHMVIGLTVLGYVLHRTGRSFRDIGLRWTGGGLALALPLWLLGELLDRVQIPIIYWLGQTFGRPGWHPPDVGDMIHASGIQIATIAVTLLVGFYEELIVRAYLMTEIISRTNKPWLAIVISVVIQTSYHFYQGVPLALSHIFLFTLFAVFYAKTRSILPVAVAHSLVDLDSTWNYGLSKMFPY